jgi:hypothetical protein
MLRHLGDVDLQMLVNTHSPQSCRGPQCDFAHAHKHSVRVLSRVREMGNVAGLASITEMTLMPMVRCAHAVLLGVAGLMTLSGCGGSSLSGMHDTVTLAPSVSGKVQVVTGGSQALTLTFNSSDGQRVSQFAVTQGLASLPSGWTGPTAFGCATVSAGSGCALTLTYAPTAIGGGSLSLAFHYVDNAGTAQDGTVVVSYSSSSADNVIATAAPTGQINAMVGGGSQAVQLTFTTDDGAPATQLAVTTDLTALPAGWSAGTRSFACATVSTGSGCQLALMFAPTKVIAAGSLTLEFSYTDNSGQAKTGTAVVAYSSTEHDNVVATASPTGQITAVAGGGAQPVTVTFTTDDGNPATGLTVTTDLASLPAGWSSSAHTLSCTRISTGNGCQMAMNYAPTAGGSGALTLQYSYTDNAGAAKNGTLTIPYTATTHDNVAGTAAPSGQVSAVVGAGAQAVSVTFNTDDGNVATNLVLTTALNALPTGWSSGVQSFSCGNVSTGAGCHLNLSYAPNAAASGTLALHYSYADNAGTARTGTVNVPYVATAHDNVVGTASPAAPISVLVNGSQPLGVTFTTDDGNPATQFSVTSGLSSLPVGWSGPGSLSCASVTSGNGCQLSLTYAPMSVAAGTVSIGYAYTDNAGAAKTGTVSIPYSATVHDNVVGAASPAGPIHVAVNSSQTATVSFTTDDGNSASAFSVTTDLTALPGGWTSLPTSLACASVSTGTGCELALTYAPTASDSGTLTVNFSYVDNAGTQKTGTASIAYSAAVQHAYVSDRDNGVYICSITGTGGLSGCATTGGGFTGAWSVAFFTGTTATYAYVVNGARNAVYLCSVDSSGQLSNSCASAGSNFDGPEYLRVSGSRLYVANQGFAPGSNVVTVCSIDNTDGTLSGCSLSADGSGLRYASGVTVDGSYAYVATDNAGLYVCGVDSTSGALSSCVSTGGGSVAGAYALAISGGVAYIANHDSGFATCTVGSDGTLSSCGNQALGSFDPGATGVAINGGYAYMTVQDMFFSGAADVYLCSISGLTVSGCAVSDGGATFSQPFDVIIN